MGVGVCLASMVVGGKRILLGAKSDSYRRAEKWKQVTVVGFYVKKWQRRLSTQ